jgi:hypothetical protein
MNTPCQIVLLLATLKNQAAYNVSKEAIHTRKPIPADDDSTSEECIFLDRSCEDSVHSR